MSIQLDHLHLRDFWRYLWKVIRRAAFRWFYKWGDHLPFEVLGAVAAVFLTEQLSWWSIFVVIVGAMIPASVAFIVQVIKAPALIDIGQERRLALLSGARTEAEVQRTVDARTTLYKMARRVVRRWEDLGAVLSQNPASERHYVQRLRESFDVLEEQYNLLDTTTSFRYSSPIEQIRQVLRLDIPPDQLHGRLRAPMAVLCEVVSQEETWDARRQTAEPARF